MKMKTWMLVAFFAMVALSIATLAVADPAGRSLAEDMADVDFPSVNQWIWDNLMFLEWEDSDGRLYFRGMSLIPDGAEVIVPPEKIKGAV